MTADVFAYFLSIGAGLAVGVSVGLIPGYLAINWIRKRGGDQHVKTKVRA